MAIGLLLALAAPAYFYWMERASAAVAAADGFAVPPRDSAWMREPETHGDWLPKAERAEQTTIASYRSGQATVTKIVAFYPVPKRGNPLTRTAINVIQPEPWQLVETGRIPAAVAGRTLVVNTAKIARDGQQRLVWWFYVIDGRPTGGVLEAKLLQAAAGLHGERRLGALVALSIGISPDAIGSGAATLADFAAKLAPL